MGDRCELFGRGGAHCLGGRVGYDEVGMELFEARQFPDQRVVLGVGDFRRVQFVILFVVKADLFPEFGYPILGANLLARHTLGRFSPGAMSTFCYFKV